MTNKQDTSVEWESKYWEMIHDKLDYPAAHKSKDGFACTPDEMFNFIRTQIEKAEQRGYDKAKRESHPVLGVHGGQG